MSERERRRSKCLGGQGCRMLMRPAGRHYSLICSFAPQLQEVQVKLVMGLFKILSFSLSLPLIRSRSSAEADSTLKALEEGGVDGSRASR